MAKVVCSKCGMVGESKCPHCRSVFPEWSSAEFVIDHMLRPVKEVEEGMDGKKRYAVPFSVWSNSPEEATLEVLTYLKHALALIPEENLKRSVCNHDFQFADGETSEIGCGHGYEKGSMDVLFGLLVVVVAVVVLLIIFSGEVGMPIWNELKALLQI